MEREYSFMTCRSSKGPQFIDMLVNPENQQFNDMSGQSKSQDQGPTGTAEPDLHLAEIGSCSTFTVVTEGKGIV